VDYSDTAASYTRPPPAEQCGRASLGGGMPEPHPGAIVRGPGQLRQLAGKEAAGSPRFFFPPLAVRGFRIDVFEGAVPIIALQAFAGSPRAATWPRSQAFLTSEMGKTRGVGPDVASFATSASQHRLR